jgi:hypothetical protein
MTRRKTTDPRLLALLDKKHKANERFERWYVRLKRAFTALEKERQRLMRLERAIRKLEGADRREDPRGAPSSHQ